MAIAEDSTPESLLARVRLACLSLPEVAETVAWGDPAFQVAGRVFAGFGLVVPWGPVLRLRVGAAQQRALLQDSRFFPTPRLLHRGWVSLKLVEATDWSAVAELVRATYKGVAPPRVMREQRHAAPGDPADGGGMIAFWDS